MRNQSTRTVDRETSVTSRRPYQIVILVLLVVACLLLLGYGPLRVDWGGAEYERQRVDLVLAYTDYFDQVWIASDRGSVTLVRPRDEADVRRILAALEGVRVVHIPHLRRLRGTTFLTMKGRQGCMSVQFVFRLNPANGSRIAPYLVAPDLTEVVGDILRKHGAKPEPPPNPP